MENENPLVVALRALCETHGGYEKVATEIKANAQTLYQITSRVKLPSGRPRGVGASLQRRLDERYPGWREARKGRKAAGYVINQYNTGGKMGNGLVLRDQPGVIHSWTVSPEWLRQNVHRITTPKNLVIVTGFGDSMRPMFNPGDPLLVDTGRKRADVDGIYFFRVGEEGFIKRLQRIPTDDGLILRAKSENQSYDPFDITESMDFEVFGWVVKVWCGENF